MFQTFPKRRSEEDSRGENCLKSAAVPSIFSWIRTSPRKRKPPTERYTCKQVASPSATPTSSRSDASPESVSRFEMQNQMEVNIALTFSDIEMEDMNSNELSEMESCDRDLAEAIAGQNKRITDLEQEIADLKSQLQNAQRQIRNLMEKQFTLENLKSKNNTAPFYTGFNSWDAFEAVYNYLDPGERGEKIVYWRSVNAEVSVDYDKDQSEESYTKKGRARSLRPVDEFFIVICRLR